MEYCRYSLRLWQGDSSHNVDHLLASTCLSEYRHASKRRLPSMAWLDRIDGERPHHCPRRLSGFHTTLNHTDLDLLNVNDVDHTLEFDNRHLGGAKSVVMKAMNLF